MLSIHIIRLRVCLAISLLIIAVDLSSAACLHCSYHHPLSIAACLQVLQPPPSAATETQHMLPVSIPTSQLHSPANLHSLPPSIAATISIVCLYCSYHHLLSASTAAHPLIHLRCCCHHLTTTPSIHLCCCCHHLTATPSIHQSTCAAAATTLQQLRPSIHLRCCLNPLQLFL